MVYECDSIFITGATGLIGRALIKYIDNLNRKKEHEYCVVAAVRDVSKAKKKLGNLIDDNHIEFYQYDNSLEIEYPGKVDWIICAGAQANKIVIDQRPVEAFESNMFGVIHCLEYARKRKVKGMVFLSSSVVYGKSARGPFKENYIGTVDYANDPYSASKISGEALCRAYYDEYNVPAKIVRLFQVYDSEEGDRGTFLADCLKSCKADTPIIIRSDGKNTRNLIHSEDAASAILVILFSGDAGETYNIGSKDGNYTFYEIAKKMSEVFGRGNSEDSIVVEGNSDGSCDYQVPDITKILKLGWAESKGTFYQELARTLNQAGE